jgi:myosin heavy subunit
MYYVVDIVLFLLALFVIVFYRFLDRKDRQIHLVKAYIDRMKQEVTAKEKSLQATFSQIEDDLQVREKSVRSLLKRIDQSLEELEQHAGDLNELQSYMSHYHRILKELSALTEKAEQRLSLLQEQYQSMDESAQRISELQQQEEMLSRQLEEHRKQKIEALDSESSQEIRKQFDLLLNRGESRLSKLSKSFEREYDNAMEALQKRMDTLLEEAREAIENQTSEAVEHLDEQKKTYSTLSSGDRGSAPLVDWRNNGISREVSQAAAELYDKNDEPDEHIQLFDEIDQDDDDLPASSIMEHLQEDEHPFDEDHEVFDDVDLHDEPEIPVEEPEEDLEDEDDHDEDVLDDEMLDRIYYEEDEAIILDDDEPEQEDEQEEAPEISPDKRRIVSEHLKDGFSVDEIQELTDIPKGEIELIRELLEYS